MLLKLLRSFPSGFCLVPAIMMVLFAGSCRQKRDVLLTSSTEGMGYLKDHFSTIHTDWLDTVAGGVYKLYSVATYTTFQFQREAAISGYSIASGLYNHRAYGIITTSETVFGTACWIGLDGNRATLVTARHVVDLPDTLISWFEPVGNDPVRYIRSFSVKTKQENWIREMSGCGPFTLLAADPELDIAFIGRECAILPSGIHMMPCRAGKAGDLSWGSRLCIFGFPMGTRVVTEAMASPLPKREFGGFTVDALLNKGFSGGPLLAARAGQPGFELVGIVSRVSSDPLNYLRPADDLQRYPEWIPYTDEIRVGISEIITYGLNEVVTVDAARSLYLENREKLIRAGHGLDTFFGLAGDEGILKNH